MKKQKKPPRLRRWLIGGLFALIAVFIFGALSYGYIKSRIVHIDRITIYLDDLPAAFDGKTILFVSDIDIVGVSGPGTASGVFKKLQKLQPDLLILGGDYAGYSLMNELNSTGDEQALSADRREFFYSLAGFHAPLGKYAVIGDNDAGAADIAAEMALGQITCISGSSGTIKLGDYSINLVGLSDTGSGSTNCSEISRNFTSDDCVIVVTHNPASISEVMTAEASDTGQWCDLILSGHTHHGQVVVGDRQLIPLTQQEMRFGSGWSNEGGVYILVSPGLGCETVNLRLGTTAQVHFITLRQKQAFNFE